MTETENYLRAVEFRHPEWIPYGGLIRISVRNETVGAYPRVRPFYAASAEQAHTQVHPYERNTLQLEGNAKIENHEGG